MKKFFIRILSKVWYARWLSQYNNMYSRESLRLLINKILEIWQENQLNHLSDYEFILTHESNLSVLCRDIKKASIIAKNPGEYKKPLYHFIQEERSAIHFYKYQKDHYRNPDNALYDLFTITIELLNTIESGPTYYHFYYEVFTPLLEDVYQVAQFYFEHAIGNGDKIRNA